jgi:hypothetical protein
MPDASRSTATTLAACDKVKVLQVELDVVVL